MNEAVKNKNSIFNKLATESKNKIVAKMGEQSMRKMKESYQECQKMITAFDIL